MHVPKQFRYVFNLKLKVARSKNINVVFHWNITNAFFNEKLQNS
jgi:hypothetical protein